MIKWNSYLDAASVAMQCREHMCQDTPCMTKIDHKGRVRLDWVEVGFVG